VPVPTSFDGWPDTAGPAQDGMLVSVKAIVTNQLFDHDGTQNDHSGPTIRSYESNIETLDTQLLI
jgi:hypothetical protein